MRTILNEPRKQFNKDCSEELQEELLRLTYTCYDESLTEVSESGYENEQISDIYPLVRKVRMDALLYRLCFRGFPGVTARLQYNIGHNCHHTVLISGNTILTTSFVENEENLPRIAMFRGFYAGDPNVFEIVDQYQAAFGISDDENILRVLDYLPLPGERNYAILLHGQVVKGLDRSPAFVKIIFPNSDLSGKLDDSIDLRLKYPNVVNDMLCDGKEIKDNIKDNIKIKLNKSTQETLL